MSVTSRSDNNRGGTAGTDSTSIKVNTPDTFHGDRRKLRAFVAQCDLYIRLNPQRLASSEAKVMFATTYLRDGAFDWFEPYLTDHLENPVEDRKTETKNLFSSYKHWRNSIRKIYGGVDEERTAERQIQELRQATSATEYASKFQQISSRLDWDDAALTAKYYLGLKASVKDEIARIERPDDLIKMVETSIKIDSRLYERQMERGRKGSIIFSQPKNRANSSKSRQLPRNYYPREMDLDATHKRKFTAKNRKGKISGVQRDERMRKNLCLYCGKPGHRARECPNKQSIHAMQGQPDTELGWDLVQPEEEDTDLRTKGDAREKETSAPEGGKQDTGIVEKQDIDWTISNLATIPEEPQHSHLSWTACYDDKCAIHMSDKDGSGWYPKKPRKKRQAKQTLNALVQVPEEPDPWYIDSLEDSDDWEELIEPSTEILAVTANSVKMRTNLWKRIVCEDAFCTQEAQHQHRVYDPEVQPKVVDSTLTIILCQDEDCPYKDQSEKHSHQGGNHQEESGDIVRLDEEAEVWEQAIIRAPEGRSQATVVDRRFHPDNGPFGHFECEDALCSYKERWPEHTHFRNYEESGNDPASQQ
jgi:Retrotransposon gag protein/Zinc knuckle